MYYDYFQKFRWDTVRDFPDSVTPLNRRPEDISRLLGEFLLDGDNRYGIGTYALYKHTIMCNVECSPQR